MKNIFSFIACILVCIVLVQYRVSESDINGKPPLKVTVWDAFGYYAYLPAICIYHDCKQLNWLTEIDKKYQVTGGDGWQAQKADNGNYVFKYLGGVAIMELPFFYIGDIIAKHSHYPPDGFSPPYQYALGFGVIFYCLLAILLLRKILLLYFKDITVAITILMVCLATNFIQYAAVDNGQSHGYIFPLYVLVLFTTLKWHQKPKVIWAILTGYIIGLATISRPTEAIMLFIPLMWDTHTKETAKEKWQLVKQHKAQIALAALGGLIGILPQLIYWKYCTGSFIYDVGSKWEFLNPHFRVLFGWEKGWFIYTPVTVLFIVGMFFMKGFPFRKSVLWFCLLNIYIIIAWHDWRYGGSYSTRALVQSYPLFALPFAALTEKISLSKWRIPFYLLCAYLLFVNLFQVRQYCDTVLHYNDMNRRYYARIYLNPRPTPIDMSLLDNDESLNNEAKYQKMIIVNTDSTIQIHAAINSTDTFIHKVISNNGAVAKESWLKISCTVKAPGHLWQNYLNAKLVSGDSSKHSFVRLFNAISYDTAANQYAWYMRIPPYLQNASLQLYITSPGSFDGTVEKISVVKLDK